MYVAVLLVSPFFFPLIFHTSTLSLPPHLSLTLSVSLSVQLGNRITPVPLRPGVSRFIDIFAGQSLTHVMMQSPSKPVLDFREESVGSELSHHRYLSHPTPLSLLIN